MGPGAVGRIKLELCPTRYHNFKDFSMCPVTCTNVLHLEKLRLLTWFAETDYFLENQFPFENRICINSIFYVFYVLVLFRRLTCLLLFSQHIVYST